MKQEFTGKSLEEAIALAAKDFGVDSDQVRYRILPNQPGFLSKLFTTRAVRIEAWVEDTEENLEAKVKEAALSVMKLTSEPDEKNKEEKNVLNNHESSSKENANIVLTTSHKNEEKVVEKQDTTSESKPTHEPLPPLSPEAKQLLQEFSEKFFAVFKIEKNQVSETTDEKGNHIIAIQDEFFEDLLTRSDKLSVAFEHIFKRLAQKKIGDVSQRIYLKAGCSDERREQLLVEFARSLAEKVKRTGRPTAIASKTSQERRIIHIALDGYEGVKTRSVGLGEKRKLIIYPVDENGNEKIQPNTNYTPHRKRPRTTPQRRNSKLKPSRRSMNRPLNARSGSPRAHARSAHRAKSQ